MSDEVTGAELGALLAELPVRVLSAGSGASMHSELVTVDCRNGYGLIFKATHGVWEAMLSECLAGKLGELDTQVAWRLLGPEWNYWNLRPKLTATQAPEITHQVAALPPLDRFAALTEVTHDIRVLLRQPRVQDALPQNLVSRLRAQAERLDALVRDMTAPPEPELPVEEAQGGDGAEQARMSPHGDGEGIIAVTGNEAEPQ